MRPGMNCIDVDQVAHWLTLQIPEPFRRAVMREVRRFNRFLADDSGSDSKVEVPSAMMKRGAQLGKKIT